ncbi:MAG: fibronectin type III domain-containing protein [Elusimicrobia bacterium]|nr:fibronectin type III domain-containing protein [Elusimicrobiota bacterium]
MITTAFSAAESTKTLPAGSFGTAGLSGVGTSSLTVSWTHDFTGGTPFYASLSTDAFATVNLTSMTLGSPVVFGTGGEGPALSPDTTYYARVSTDAAGSFTSAGSTATLAMPPSGATALDVQISSLTLAWGPADNPPWTRYLADISTDDFATVNLTSATLETGATFYGLDPNTTYYLRVAAVNHGGTRTSWDVAEATATLALPVRAPQVYKVRAASIIANWAPHPASPPEASSMTAEGYVLEASLASDFSGSVISSRSAGVALATLTVSGLQGLPYHLRVGSLNRRGAVNYTGLGTATPFGDVPAGCSTEVSVKLDASRDFAGIQAALDSLPKALTGDTCVVIRDTQTYEQEVIVQGFVNGGWRLSIMSDPSFVSSAPVVSPPPSTLAGFRVLNDSVTIQGISVVPAASLSYGITASSAFVTLSSVNIVDEAGHIVAAGIALSSWSVLSGSSITVRDAEGARLSGAGVSAASSSVRGATALSISGCQDAAVAACRFAGGAQGCGIRLDAGNGGVIRLSGNTVEAGARYGISIGAQSSGAQVIVASNTVLLSANAGWDTYGIYLDGLVTGGAFYNNGIYYRSGADITGRTTYGLYANSVSGIDFHHNRINQPGLVTGGSVVSAYFSGAADSGFRFNDVNSTGTGLTNAYLFQLANSAVTIKNNIFHSSWTISGSSASLAADIFSSPGPDYNDWAGSSADPYFIWGMSFTPANWQLAGKDANSRFAQPLWYDPSAGVEDFHPRSKQGRYDPQTRSFVSDGVVSPTIDAADPSESYDLEPSPNGSRANQGSYGDTAEASKSLSAPGSVSVAAVNGSSVTLSFSPVASDGYSAEAALAADFSGAITSKTADGSASMLSPQGLAYDTTYYLRVGALYGAAYSYASAVPASTITLAAVPAAAAAGPVRVSSLTLTWASGGNPAWTRYLAQISTDSFATLNLATTTLSRGATFYGLDANTTYYLRVAALSGSGILAGWSAAAAATLAEAPAAALTGVYATSASFSWTTGANPVGTRYLAQASTDGFATVSASSATLEPGATFFGLLGSTTYYLRAQAVNWAGTGSDWSVLEATATRAAAPVPGAPSGVTAGAVTANWSGNGPGALNTVQISTDDFSSVNASSQTRNSFAAFGGLQADTTYYFRVRATGYDGQSTDWTVLPSTMTKLLAPGMAGTTFATVAFSSAVVAWTSGGNGPGTQYVCSVSTNDFATVKFASTTYALEAWFGAGGAGPALQPDTTHYFQVRAQSASGASSADVPLGSTVTWAALPLGPDIGEVRLSSLSVSWGVGGNPPWTRYLAQVSTDGFATINAGSETLMAAATFYGLAADTTFYLRVGAVNQAGHLAGWAVSAATATLTAVPGEPWAELGLTTATLSWSDSGNPRWTWYGAQISTDGFATVNVTSRTLMTSAAFSSLAPDTTYYMRVRAEGWSRPSDYALAAASPTWAEAPTAALTGVFTTSASLAWTTGANPPGARYLAQASSDGFVTVSASSATLNSGATFFGLLGNTTYHLRVQAVNWAGTGTAWSVLEATATMAAAPVPGAPSAVTAGAVTANWSGNGPGALNTAQISTDSFSSVNASSQTRNSYATFGGLQADTTYYFRARATGYNGTSTDWVALPSTMTLLLSPGTAPTTFVGVGFSSAAVAWTSGGNGPSTLYLCRVSTDGFATVNFTSTTYELGAWFGTGGAGPALQPNTTHQFQVQARSASGSSSLFVSLGSTVTRAFPPSGTAVLAASSAAVSLDWSPNGNPEPGTAYEVWRDVDPAFPAPARLRAATSAFVASGLEPRTAYYFRVRVRANDGGFTDFDAAVTTTTLPPAPGAPGTPAGAALGVSSISWSWTAAPDADSYLVHPASNPAVLIAATAAPSFFQTGLATNTAYGILVNGLGVSGLGPLSAAATVYTLAMPPANTAASAVHATSATIAWSLNTNPAGTSAEVERSTDNVSFAGLFTGAATGFSDSGLLGCTDYYYRVRNRSGGGVPTGFDSVVHLQTTASTPAPPNSLAAGPADGGRISLSWLPSVTEGVVEYRLYTDGGTGSVDYGSPLQVFTAGETSWTTGVLPSSAAYAFALRAKHRCGVEETRGVLALSPSTGTLAGVRASIATPESGKRVWGNRITVLARLAAGTPDQVRQILFEYRPSGSSDWASLSPADPIHPNPALSSPFFIHVDVTGWAPGSYDLRATALSAAGVLDTAPAAVTVTVDHAEPDIDENLADGKVEKNQTINNAIVNTITAAGAEADDPMARILFPAGSLCASTVTVKVICNPEISTAVPAGFRLAGSAVRVLLDCGANLNAAAVVTLSYPAGAASASGFQARSLEESTGRWSTLGAPVIDAVNRTVAIDVPHFTIVALGTGGAAADLSSARVYPNPFKPNGPNPDEGRPYSSGNSDSGIVFDNLPLLATIRVYTASGQLAAELVSSDGSGRLQWDGRNGSGRDLASGGYLVVISSPGSKSVVKKIAIIR